MEERAQLIDVLRATLTDWRTHHDPADYDGPSLCAAMADAVLAHYVADGQRMARYLDEAEQATERAEAQVAALRSALAHLMADVQSCAFGRLPSRVQLALDNSAALLAAPPETP